MWNRPLFRNGVIFGLAGVVFFRLSLAVTTYFFVTLPTRSGLKSQDPPLILVLLALGFLLMALGGVIAIVASLIIGDKGGRENQRLR